MTEEIVIQEGFKAITVNNTSNEKFTFLKEVETTFIQLHFCVNCNSSLFFKLAQN